MTLQNERYVTGGGRFITYIADKKNQYFKEHILYYLSIHYLEQLSVLY